MKEYIEERAIKMAEYIIENKTTVRQTAKEFGISKSTVHKDVTERLAGINPVLAAQARKVLDVNKSERHIRGGNGNQRKILTYEIEPESACCGVRQADFWYGDVGLRATGEKLG